MVGLAAVAVILILLLAVYGFRISLGGRKLIAVPD